MLVHFNRHEWICPYQQMICNHSQMPDACLIIVVLLMHYLRHHAEWGVHEGWWDYEGARAILDVVLYLLSKAEVAELGYYFSIELLLEQNVGQLNIPMNDFGAFDSMLYICIFESPSISIFISKLILVPTIIIIQHHIVIFEELRQLDDEFAFNLLLVFRLPFDVFEVPFYQAWL